MARARARVCVCVCVCVCMSGDNTPTGGIRNVTLSKEKFKKFAEANCFETLFKDHYWDSEVCFVCFVLQKFGHRNAYRQNNFWTGSLEITQEDTGVFHILYDDGDGKCVS